MKQWRRIFGQDDAAAPAAAAPPSDPLEAVEQLLEPVLRRVDAAAGRMPPPAVVRAHDVGDAVRQLLRELERRRTAGSSPDALVMVTLESTVKDYLPTSVDSFLAVTDLADVGDPGAARVAEEQLCAQLELLADGVLDLVDSVRSGTASPLDVQGRFLQTKFGKSDLAL